MKLNDYMILNELSDEKVAERMKLNRLWNAVKNNDLAYFQGYIDANGNVDVLHNKNSLLTTAAFNGRDTIVNMLLPRMKNDTIRHKINGESAGNIATKPGNNDISEIISKKIAKI